jgi:uncharacterized protein YcnI
LADARARVAAAALAFAAALVAAPGAFGHGTLTPTSAQAGSTQTFDLTVPSDRLDADIVGVALRMPDDVQVEAAEAQQPLWTVVWDETGVRWEGGPIDRGGAATFRFTARMPADEGIVPVTLVETYDDGAAAPFELTIGVGGGAGGGSDGLALAALVVAIAALIASTAALALVLKGRRPT